ncbi:hypothetical protein NW762_006464 [Fusarium torreyae]|uniref:Fido domain-containing protein n=1 Tax=Fusarium torreyae TaxID=1237075 RepID=A0A9W8S3H4_9HYPO|nr:hypothetical protein NW762_006464 [Fusarium torreyae]
MPSKHKRQSLSEGPFPGLDLENPQDEETHLGRSIRLMMASNLRGNGSVRTHSRSGGEATFTINMGHAYDHDILGDTTPDQVHSELRKYISEIAESLKKLSKENALDEYLTEQLAQMVYGSNMIEMAGGGLDITLKLCRAIFRGEEVPENITERDSDYEDHKRHLMQKNLPSGHKAVLRSHREIIQHAQAARYMIEEICIHGKDLSEGIIREAHALLTHKIDLNERTPWIYYSGVYRTWNVRCGTHVFMDESRVPFAMRDMIESLESDIKSATEKGEIDPVLLASKYCHEFVNIHPFGDGNGRMCRLILNALLLKYSGGIVCFGQNGEDRQEYLRIAVDASAKEALKNHQNKVTENEPDGLKPKNYKQLASFTLRHARDNMRKIRQIFKRDD